MARLPRSKKVIVVSGDVTADWNIARLIKGKDSGGAWNASDTTRVCFQAGGAAMLGNVIEALTSKLDTNDDIRYGVHRIHLSEDKISHRDNRYHHSYSMWAVYPQDKKSEAQKSVWRVQEFLGLDIADQYDAESAYQSDPKDPGKANLVVIDDAALGFRDKPEIWPKSIKTPANCDWIIMKMASPVAQGPLWDHIMESCGDRTIALMTVNDLRRSETHISRVLSWEKTAQDLFWELLHNPVINGLSRCKHVIVSLGTSGAMLLSPVLPKNKKDFKWECTLYYDPRFSESTWERDYPGGMIGYMTCLTAAIVRQLLIDNNKPDLDMAIQTGIHAMRCLHIHGFGAQSPGGPLNQPDFPIAAVLDATFSDQQPLSVAVVRNPLPLRETPLPEAESEYWTILDDISSSSGGKLSLGDRARVIVEQGHDAGLKDLPLGQFGALSTVDRNEIESFRSIQALMAEYYARPKGKPLNIAVFGPPGSGKSFGVKQVAKSIPGAAIQDCTFNLSQFNSPQDLNDALHQVRDIALSGKMPLVFWDEFDTKFEGQNNGWLRYFLAPMQDGQFQDGQITHHIGNAIFVFAGGTCATFEEFDKYVDREAIDALEEPKKTEVKVFKEVKGPDFVSRLQGFVNIMGPNQLNGVIPGGDKHFAIRRAIVLRNLIQSNAPCLFEDTSGKGKLHIDSGVLRAFLYVSKYKHGVRSMEAIINMSSLTGRSSFERSSLPPEAQLNLHVNGREFLSLVQQPDLNDPVLLNKLAEANHKVYTVALKGKPGAPAAAGLPYSALSTHLKQQNIDSVRDIPNKLSKIGHIMISARSGDPLYTFPGPYLEMLSEMEHERYLAAKVEAGWKYGPKRSDKNKTNPCLKPWRKLSDKELNELPPKIAAAIKNEDLPEDEKEKDREIIRAIPGLLSMAGYTIVDMNKE
ncbi:MAG: RyR domain-containing protein [Syntrophomonadaceae bacterium]